MKTPYELVAPDLHVDVIVDLHGKLWLMHANLVGPHEQTDPLLVLASDEERAEHAVTVVLTAGLSEEERQALLASHGRLVEFPSTQMLARPAKPTGLEKRLRDLAAGARSKADLLASKSPTSVYTDPVDVLRALAKEAEDGLAPDPDKGLKIQRTLVLSVDHMDPGFGLFLDHQVAMRAGEEEGEQSLLVDRIDPYGWRICLTDPFCELYMTDGDADLRDILADVEMPESTEPCALPDLIRFALQHGCHWLALDLNGPIVFGLPVYEWGSTR